MRSFIAANSLLPLSQFWNWPLKLKRRTCQINDSDIFSRNILKFVWNCVIYSDRFVVCTNVELYMHDRKFIIVPHMYLSDMRLLKLFCKVFVIIILFRIHEGLHASYMAPYVCFLYSVVCGFWPDRDTNVLRFALYYTQLNPFTNMKTNQTENWT